MVEAWNILFSEVTGDQEVAHIQPADAGRSLHLALDSTHAFGHQLR